MDYISREDVLETLRKANIGGYITDRLLEIPVANVQPIKYGRWITSQPVDIAKEFKCTACGGLIELPVFAKYCYYDYCPNCGAEMDGDTDGWMD